MWRPASRRTPILSLGNQPAAARAEPSPTGKTRPRDTFLLKCGTFLPMTKGVRLSQTKGAPCRRSLNFLESQASKGGLTTVKLSEELACLLTRRSRSDLFHHRPERVRSCLEKRPQLEREQEMGSNWTSPTASSNFWCPTKT